MGKHAVWQPFTPLPAAPPPPVDQKPAAQSLVLLPETPPRPVGQRFAQQAPTSSHLLLCRLQWIHWLPCSPLGLPPVAPPLPVGHHDSQQPFTALPEVSPPPVDQKPATHSLVRLPAATQRPVGQ